MRVTDVTEDGWYVVEEPAYRLEELNMDVSAVRSIWRRETGEAWDDGTSEKRVMWFDCSEAHGTPMEAHLNPRVESAIALMRIDLRPTAIITRNLEGA